MIIAGSIVASRHAFQNCLTLIGRPRTLALDAWMRTYGRRFALPKSSIFRDEIKQLHQKNAILVDLKCGDTLSGQERLHISALDGGKVPWDHFQKDASEGYRTYTPSRT